MDNINSELWYELWLSQSFKLNQVREFLNNQGVSEENHTPYIDEYLKKIDRKRTQMGFKLIGVGSIFCFTSMILTFSNLFPDMRSFSLYGLTMIGITIGFVGLYYLMEKQNMD